VDDPLVGYLERMSTEPYKCSENFISRTAQDACKRIAELEKQRNTLLKAALEIRVWLDNWTMPMEDEPDWSTDYQAFAAAIEAAEKEVGRG
jgi:hypothetical protein